MCSLAKHTIKWQRNRNMTTFYKYFKDSKDGEELFSMIHGNILRIKEMNSRKLESQLGWGQGQKKEWKEIINSEFIAYKDMVLMRFNLGI